MQTELVNLNDLVKQNHPYRKLLAMIDFASLVKGISIKNNSEVGRGGYSSLSSLKMLVLQFMEDLSDRELERFLAENNSAKLFCDFSLNDATPDHSLFSRLRQNIGTNQLAAIFNSIREQLKQKGLIREIFTFVDSSQLISKIHLWNERDRAIAEGLEKFNNQVIEKSTKNQNDKNTNKLKISDTQARFGCKGKNKHWYGYKRHVSVDMQSGLINKVAVTPANVTDAKAVKYILPKQGAVFGDKGYATKDSTDQIRIRGLHDCTIKTNNMKSKNHDKDKWISRMRSPYERVFSKVSNRSRYRGIEKNQFQLFMESLSFNFKRLIKLEAQPLVFAT